MRTKCYYNLEWNETIESLLKENNVDYKKVEWKDTKGSVISYPDMINFTISKEQPAYAEIKDFLPNPNTCWLEFTEKELKESKWLYMRSTNMKIDIQNDAIDWLCPKNRLFNKKSMFHMTQKDIFEIKPVKWTTNNHFYSSYVCGYDAMFCDDYAMNIMQQNDLKGVVFDNVLQYRNKTVLSNTHHIKCDKILPLEAFLFDENCEERKCPTCGKSKYEINHEFRIKIRKEYLDENIDFFSTPDIFSMGNVSSYTIVSNRVYTVLKNAKLTRNLNFEPVITI